MADREARLTEARQHLDAMVDDPFWGAMLRETVPRGEVVSVALADELVSAAAVRAVMDNRRDRGFVAVFGADLSEAPTLLVVALTGEDGLTFSVRRPGDSGALPGLRATKTTTIGEVIAYLADGFDKLDGA